MAVQSRRARRRWPWVLGVTLGLLLAGYAGTAWAVSDRVPSGVSVAGVDIGGQSRDRAVDILQQRLGPTLGDPVVVAVGDARDRIDPVEAGLAVDIPATVDALVGFSLDPRVVWRHLGGNGSAQAETTADGDRLAAALRALAERVDTEPTEGAITFRDGAALATPAAAGRQLDVEAAAGVLQSTWPTAAEHIDLPVRVTQPQVGQDAVDAAMASFATPATAGPLLVKVGDVVTQVPVADVTPALSLQPKDGDLVPQVDGQVLKQAVLKADPQLESKPKNARIEISGGRPVVVPGANGVTLDPAALADAAVTALASPERTAVIDSAVVEPELTTAEAGKLGVKEKVSEFSSTLTANAARTENLRIAARTVNGTLLLPGETFSLNGTLGERTPAKGYQKAGTISGGRFVDSYGGGVSQMATTLFNGMFFAGLQDVEHQAHSLYISRYPEGREATVNWPGLDLKFKNDSPHGVLIETWVAGGQVHTRFWSTKVWDITATKGPRTNFRQPRTIVDTSPKCTAQGAQPGFDVSVTRVFSKGGSVVKRETFRTRYSAQHKVVCEQPKPATPPSPSPTQTPTVT